MATQRRRPRANTAARVQDMTKVRPETSWVQISDIIPYEFNARDNKDAIRSVANSIETFGFVVPVVIDDDGNLAAGHTRVEAAKLLGMDEVLALRASHLTTDQIDAFRLVDNKVSELARWDTDLLGQELARLEGLFDFTSYGWTQDQIDCLSQIVEDDCLSVADVAPDVAEESSRGVQRRAPVTVRFVLGEHVFFVPRASYVAWIDGLRRLHNFESEAMDNDIKDRLGILE